MIAVPSRWHRKTVAWNQSAAVRCYVRVAGLTRLREHSMAQTPES